MSIEDEMNKEVLKNFKELNKTIEIDNKHYNLKVGFYEDSKYLKVLIQDLENGENTEITMPNIELINPPPTPEYVLLNINENEKIINKLLELKILDFYYLSFAKFNLEKLYKYDKEGTSKFIDYHTTKIEYIKNKGNSIQEVKSNIKNEIITILNQKETKKYLLSECGTSRFEIKYILINTKILKSSIGVIIDYTNENICFISPYIKELKYKIKIIQTYNIDYEEALMCYLEKGYKILSINKELHNKIWDEIEEKYPNFLYENGIKKYLRYCKTNNINKITLRKGYWSTKNIMRLYEKIRMEENEVKDLI